MDIRKIVENIKHIDYSKIDIDDYLNQRDESVFDDEWVNIYRQIKEGKIPQNIKEQSDDYRENVFLAIDEKTNGSELADYVSDDIELLIFADYLNISSRWFEKFIEAYENSVLPTGKL